MLKLIYLPLLIASITFTFRSELEVGLGRFAGMLEASAKVLNQSLCDEGDACGNKELTQPSDDYLDLEPLTPLPNHNQEKDKPYSPLPNHGYEKDKPYIPSDMQSHEPSAPSNPGFSRKPSAPNISPFTPDPSLSTIPDCEVEGWAQFQLGIQKGVLPCKSNER